jgi:L-aminopeptidase/D-esterase-like protein
VSSRSGDHGSDADFPPSDPAPGSGSIITIVATDAPLVAHQLKRLARRVPLGIARVGGMGADNSGDIFMAFSTANPAAALGKRPVQVEMLPNDQMTPLFEAVIQATEKDHQRSGSC